MTENERITKLDIIYTATNIKNELDSFTISQAFNKLQRYECLGTVEEFKVLKEKEERFERNIKMFYEIGLKIRAKAIDEFANWLYENHKTDLTEYIKWYEEEIAEQLKAGGIIG